MNIEEKERTSAGRRLLSNRPFVLIWGGQVVSFFGDAFFNLAVMWIVYSRSNSALQTSIVSAVFHLSGIIAGPFAGLVADRSNRARVILVNNMLAAAVVGALAIVMLKYGQIVPLVAFISVFLLNCLTAFLAPARFALMPAVVSRDLFMTATGWAVVGRQIASLLGGALAGVVISLAGATWAMAIDACSFVVAGLAVVVAPLPTQIGHELPSQHERTSALRAIVDGWRVIIGQPTLRMLVLLTVLANVPSFLGALYPALIRTRLHGGVVSYGLLDAVSAVGVMVGGFMAGAIERRVGAGHLQTAGRAMTGICLLGMSVSTWLPLTAAMEFGQALGLTMSSVCTAALSQALVPEAYLGRVSGLSSSLGVIVVPISTLIGGWLADMLGVAPLFFAGGTWILCIAALGWLSHDIRDARI